MKKFKTLVTYDKVSYDYRVNRGQVVCDLVFSIDLNRIPGIYGIADCSQFVKLVNKYQIREYNDHTLPDVVFNVRTYADTKTGDKYDKEFGRKLALTRAQKEAFIIARDFYKKLATLMINNCQRLSQFVDNCQISVNRCREHSQELITQKY